MLARGLAANGHHVTLFAHVDSTWPGHLVPWPGKSSGSRHDTLLNAAKLASVVAKERFDVVHSFSRMAYLAPILPFSLPKIMSYQREINPRSVIWANALSRGSLRFTAISRWMMQHVENCGRWSLIPNGVPLSRYTFRREVAQEAPFVFLGRIEEIKGPHLAIEIARRANRRLVIAGNIPSEKRSWVEKNVLRYVDGKLVQFVGPVDDLQKNIILSEASALLMPILWEEPFGIVMAEAMACGTPVLGLRRGAVPEVVVDGITGFVADSIDGLVHAAGRLGSLDRLACRARVEALYSDVAIIAAFEQLYMESLTVHQNAS